MKPRDWPKVEELYHAALERPAAEGEAFLDQACGGDEDLRREVLSLLAHEAEAERLMERPAASAATREARGRAGAAARAAASPALDRLVGQCLKKDPADRWQSSQDLALRLREIAESGSEARFADRQVVPFLATPANEMTAEFSPDGRWMAYVSDEYGRLDVHVTSYPDRRQTLLVSAGGGEVPVWSRDGSRSYYASDDPVSLMRVDVRPGARLTLGPPRVLFQVKPNVFFGNRAMVLHPDGRRFPLLRLAAPKPPTPITRLNVVHNWFAELERLAPTRR